MSSDQQTADRVHAGDDRAGPPAAGDETATVLGALERQRATFAWKVGGLDSAALATTVGASSLTLGGLLKHLAFIEEIKFSTMLHGRPPGAPWDTVDWDGDGDWPWHSAALDSPDDLYALWNRAVIQARSAVAEAVADGGMDRRVRNMFGDPGEPLSLRRLLADVIEEYARHTGHADVIRESTDGVVGEDPPELTYPYPPVS